MNFRRVTVRTTPACQRVVIQILIERCAVIRKLATVLKPLDGYAAQTHVEAYDVVIEAEIDPAQANSVFQALGEVSSAGNPVTICITPMLRTEGDWMDREPHEQRAPQEVKWGDFLITI